MQQTRKLILQYIKERGSATVDELAGVLNLTSVTVRHHLDILRSDALVAEPETRHRSSPGRPQYAYTLTEKASEYFPKNYCDLAAQVLAEVRATVGPQATGAFYEHVAGRMAAPSAPCAPDEPLPARLDRAVTYLNSQGYVASWESVDGGFQLSTRNCPYEALAGDNPELCGMDLALVERLVGQDVHCLCRVSEGAATCSYLVAESGCHSTADHAPVEVPNGPRPSEFNKPEPNLSN